MDDMPALTRNSSYARRVGVAMGLSIGLHAALGLALLQQPTRNNQEELNPLRLSGGTFDVEAFQESAGSPPEAESETASAANTEPPPVPEAAQEAAEAPTPVEQQSPATANEPALDPRSATVKSAPTPPAHAPEPTDSSSVTSLSANPHGAMAAPQTAPPRAEPATAPIDPFDLALPGTEASGSQGAPASTQAPGGSYGEEGEPSGVVDLHAAFLKTLPLAAKADSTWGVLPLGDAGSIIVKLTIDASLKLAPIQVIETAQDPAPAHLKRMVLKNRDWLHTQRFSIGAQSHAGTQLLRITAVTSQKSPDPNTPDVTGTQALGTRGGSNPTGAYFTYFSGRHIELRVEKLGSSSNP